MTLLACLMVDDLKLNQSFDTWPLHVTLVPWFDISGENLPKLLNKLEAIAAQTLELNLILGQKALLGARKVGVSLINPVNTLTGLHKQLLKSLSDSGASLIAKSYVGELYQPHITNYPIELNSAKPLTFNKLYLVTKDNHGKWRQVVHIQELSKAVNTL